MDAEVGTTLTGIVRPRPIRRTLRATPAQATEQSSLPHRPLQPLTFNRPDRTIIQGKQ